MMRIATSPDFMGNPNADTGPDDGIPADRRRELSLRHPDRRRLAEESAARALAAVSGPGVPTVLHPTATGSMTRRARRCNSAQTAISCRYRWAVDLRRRRVAGGRRRRRRHGPGGPLLAAGADEADADQRHRPLRSSRSRPAPCSKRRSRTPEASSRARSTRSPRRACSAGRADVLRRTIRFSRSRRATRSSRTGPKRIRHGAQSQRSAGSHGRHTEVDLYRIVAGFEGEFSAFGDACRGTSRTTTAAAADVSARVRQCRPAAAGDRCPGGRLGRDRVRDRQPRLRAAELVRRRTIQPGGAGLRQRSGHGDHRQHAADGDRERRRASCRSASPPRSLSTSATRSRGDRLVRSGRPSESGTSLLGTAGGFALRSRLRRLRDRRGLHRLVAPMITTTPTVPVIKSRASKARFVTSIIR